MDNIKRVLESDRKAMEQDKEVMKYAQMKGGIGSYLGILTVSTN